MQINLSELAKNIESDRQIAVDTEKLSLVLPNEAGRISDLEELILTIRKEGPIHLILEGDARASVTVPCSRCLSEVEVEVPIAINYTFCIGEDGVYDDPDDKVSALSAGVLDIDGLIASEILLGLPAKVLCREDCKGLCPVCGQDLNKADCGCDHFVPDPRMQKIWDVFSGN